MESKKEVQELKGSEDASQYRLSLFCGNHGGDFKKPMILDEGSGVFYCKEEGCNNYLSIKEKEQLLQEVYKRVYQKNHFFESNLTGMRWRNHGIDYAILKHKNDQIQILVLNHKEK